MLIITHRGGIAIFLGHIAFARDKQDPRAVLKGDTFNRKACSLQRIGHEI